jgi:hypothetical protein
VALWAGIFKVLPMVIIVDDRRRQVAIVGLTSDHFAQLAEVIRLVRLGGPSTVREVASELRLSIPLLIRLQGRLTPVLQLSFVELTSLKYVMLWFLDLTAPCYAPFVGWDGFTGLLRTLAETPETLLESARGRNFGISRG